MRVIVNAAMSADGKIALRGGAPLKISDAADLARVHELRAACDAIIVGIGTVLADDPSLNARVGRPVKQPLRVILDSHGRLPPQARVLDATARTLVVVAEGHAQRWPNAETLEAGRDQVDLRLTLRELQARGVQTLLVEGGATVIGAFLRAGLVDDLYTYVAPIVVGGGAPTLVEGPGAAQAEHVVRMRLADARPLGEGVLLRYALR